MLESPASGACGGGPHGEAAKLRVGIARRPDHHHVGDRVGGDQRFEREPPDARGAVRASARGEIDQPSDGFGRGRAELAIEADERFETLRDPEPPVG